MQNPDRCNGRGFLFLQSVSAIQGSPELHRSARSWYQQLQARPLPCCGLIFTGGVKSLSNSRAFPHGSDKAKHRYCDRCRRRCQTLHQNQTRKRNEMPDFPIGNYAFFGVGEPAACGAGVVTVPFAVVACCNAFPRPQRDDAERGREQHSQTQIHRSRAMYAPGCGILL